MQKLWLRQLETDLKVTNKLVAKSGGLDGHSTQEKLVPIPNKLKDKSIGGSVAGNGGGKYVLTAKEREREEEALKREKQERDLARRKMGEMAWKQWCESKREQALEERAKREAAPLYGDIRDRHAKMMEGIKEERRGDSLKRQNDAAFEAWTRQKSIEQRAKRKEMERKKALEEAENSRPYRGNCSKPHFNSNRGVVISRSRLNTPLEQSNKMMRSQSSGNPKYLLQAAKRTKAEMVADLRMRRKIRRMLETSPLTCSPNAKAHGQQKKPMLTSMTLRASKTDKNYLERRPLSAPIEPQTESVVSPKPSRKKPKSAPLRKNKKQENGIASPFSKKEKATKVEQSDPKFRSRNRQGTVFHRQAKRACDDLERQQSQKLDEEWNLISEKYGFPPEVVESAVVTIQKQIRCKEARMHTDELKGHRASVAPMEGEVENAGGGKVERCPAEITPETEEEAQTRAQDSETVGEATGETSTSVRPKTEITETPAPIPSEIEGVGADNAKKVDSSDVVVAEALKTKNEPNAVNQALSHHGQIEHEQRPGESPRKNNADAKNCAAKESEQKLEEQKVEDPTATNDGEHDDDEYEDDEYGEDDSNTIGSPVEGAEAARIDVPLASLNVPATPQTREETGSSIVVDDVTASTADKNEASGATKLMANAPQPDVDGEDDDAYDDDDDYDEGYEDGVDNEKDEKQSPKTDLTLRDGKGVEERDEVDNDDDNGGNEDYEDEGFDD